MRRRTALVLPLVLALTGACRSGHHKAADVTPPPTITPVTNTTVADLTGIKLAGVPGRTTTTIGLGPGKATLTGTVTGPQGPVGGATIHVERLVGDAVAAQDFASNADGTFSIPNILGGRYRVRAYVPDPYDLAQVTPVLLFLGGTDSQKLDLQMGQFSGTAAKATIAPSPPITGDGANLAVIITTQMVDPQGIVRGAPVPGAKVELFGSGAWTVQTTNPTVTDARGLALFKVECGALGTQPLSVTVNDTDSLALALPDCVEPPPSTTTTVTEAPTTVPGPVTTTTAPRPGTTTTATSAPATTTTTSRSATTTTARPTTTTTTKKP